jgi:hypothetical protein
MERPQTLANLWTIFQLIGWIIALESITQYLSDRHYHNVYRKLVLLYFQFAGGLEGDPAIPRPPDSWQEWYNS